jgi:hypothetical protein
VPAMFTARQGEYLAFIHSYTTKVGVSPSFEDIARHFGTAPPNVNGMIKTLVRRGLLSRTPGAARSLRVLVPAEVLPGSDFGASARRVRTPAIAADARSPSAADAAATATLAALEVVMPRLPSVARRSSGSKIVIEVARAVYESLRRLGMEDSRAAEVSQRVSAERARWGRGGTRNRSPARVDAPPNDSTRARR